MKKKMMYTVGILASAFVWLAGCGEKKEENRESAFENEEKIEAEGMESTYNYLAIGNSVTRWEGKPEEVNKIWWSDYGMAADCPENDYVHRVASHLEDRKDKVKVEAVCFQEWESNEAGDRDSYLKELDDVVDEDLDLVTVQLGENITEKAPVTVQDYTTLINYLKEEAPDAQIIFLGQILWNNDEVQRIKEQAATECGVSFINLDDVRTDAQYKAGIGAEVLGDDGKMHTIHNEIVAEHPNNLGMQVIADRINQTVDAYID